MKKKKRIVPIEPETEYPIDGLNSQQVADRKMVGLGNSGGQVTTKSYGQIFASNTFTLFNGLMVVLAILVVTLGKAPMQVGFLGTCIINWIIGMVQETRAKRSIDKLTLISAPKVEVLRDGMVETMDVSDVVMDDVMLLDNGKQICADCRIIDGECEVNESLITGESDPVSKRVGDELLSGSFVVSGKARARVIHVGAANFANKISSGAKYIKSSNSEILRALRAVIRLMSILVVPVGSALFISSFLSSRDLATSVQSAVASMSGMIPQGLIALSTCVFAVAAIRLSKRNTLARDLYCIEALARVDVLCLDKTGTITEGSMRVRNLVALKGYTLGEMENALAAIINLLPDNNPTYNAIKEYCDEGSASYFNPSYICPFSSDRKWSGVSLEDGCYVMGASEFVLKERAAAHAEAIETYASEGNRVLVLAHSKTPLTSPELPADLEVMGYILITDKIRSEAPDTLRYFAEQGVDIRIISGDNPVTVSSIAREAGLAECDYIDLSTVHTDEELQEASRKYKVFGRVTPDQKLKLVKLLKADGHTVAMTGDGVNDVLALKEADCSVAMASGSDAARVVSQLVLLDNNFASMPRIVAEGRRSINNLQRSSSLYLVKTLYATLLSLLFLIPFVGQYPFSSNNITLVGIATIGVPSFFLALEPNKERVRGHFMRNTIAKALPGGLTIVLSIIFLRILVGVMPESMALTVEQQSLISLLVLTAGAFFVLFSVCMPFDWKHTLLFMGMIVVFFIGWLVCCVDIQMGAIQLNFRSDPQMNPFNMAPIDQVSKLEGIYMAILLPVALILYVVLSILSRRNLLSGERMMKALRLEDK